MPRTEEEKKDPNIFLRASVKAFRLNTEERKKLRGKVERALERAGELPEDPKEREKKIRKAYEKFKIKKTKEKVEAAGGSEAKKKLEAQDEKRLVLEGKLVAYYLSHEEKLKAAQKAYRDAELEAEQEKLRKKLGLEKDSVKDVIVRLNRAIQKFEEEVVLSPPKPAAGDMSKTTFDFNTTKELSVHTKKLYKTKLNHLAKAGYADKQALLDNQDEVVKLVDELVKRVPLERAAQEGRLYYSAIFAALHGDPLMSVPDNKFRKAFHSYDPTPREEGKKWLGVEEYKKKKAEEKDDD